MGHGGPAGQLGLGQGQLSPQLLDFRVSLRKGVLGGGQLRAAGVQLRGRARQLPLQVLDVRLKLLRRDRGLLQARRRGVSDKPTRQHQAMLSPA